MKKKTNKSLTESIKVDVFSLVHDYPELQGNIDELAGQLEDSGATVSKEQNGSAVYMIIDDFTPEEVTDIFATEYDVDIDGYIVDESLDEDYEYENDTESDFDDEDWDEDLESIDHIEDVDYAESDDLEYDDEDYIPDYDDVDIEDSDDDEIYSDEYEYEDVEFDDDDELNDNEDEEFECYEDEEFDECCESRKHKFNKHRALHEKKKGCCPGKRNHMVNLSEALKLKNSGVSVRDIVANAKCPRLNESIIRNAINKAKNESKNKHNNCLNESKNVNKHLTEKQIMLRKIKNELGEEKYNLVVKALKENKKTLYSKKTINGKNIADYTSKELHEMLHLIKEQTDKLTKSYDSINESASKTTRKELIDKINAKKHLMDILDEELTYRLTIKRLLKESKLNEDDENPLEPLPVAPETTEETSEDTSEDKDESTEDPLDAEDSEEKEETSDENETVELSRVVVTVANQEAADELKDALITAGVPEDAIEFETDSDEDESEEDTVSDEDTEDKDEDEEKNESKHYNKFKKLLEDDNEDSGNTEGDDTDATDDTEGDDTDSDDKDDSSDEPVKVVLTNTDYIHDLADVLKNEYGITKDEFEEMIGGEIVDDDSSDSDTSEEDKKDDKSEDETSSNGDDAVDAMSQEELDKLFGEN